MKGDLIYRRLINPTGFVSGNFFHLLIPALFFLTIAVSIPFGRVFEYNVDEGIYMMRAYMHMKGYALYKEVWMEQPPVLVLLLSAVFKLFGPSAQAARFLMLSFSSLLLWATYQMIAKTLSSASAICAVILLVFSAHYVKLSIAVMGSVPALALCALAIYAIVAYQKERKKRYLLLSGGVFALAVLTRFFSLIFLCGIIAGLLTTGRPMASRSAKTAAILRAGGWWLAAFTAVFSYISFGACTIDYLQLMNPYLRSVGFPGHFGQGLTLWLREEYDVLILAACALIFSRSEDRHKLTIPLVSLMAGIFIFSAHSPIWSYHRLYVIFPLCWLAAGAVHILHTGLKQHGRQDIGHLKSRIILTCACLSCSLALSAARLPSKYGRIPGSLAVGPQQPKLLALMKQYRDKTRLVVTDRPMYAFQTDLPVHPFLASSSHKRLGTNLLSPDDFIRIINAEKPEMVLFARFRWLEEKIALHLKEYTRYTDPATGFGALYISKSIVSRPGAGLETEP